MIKSMTVTLLLGGILLVAGCSKDKQEVSKKTEVSAEPKVVELTVPNSTPLVVTLADTVQTNKNQIGDRFTGRVAMPVEAAGKTVIPQGAKVNLVITKLVKGGTLKTPPEIGFTVENITLSDGKSYNVATNQIYRKGRSHTDREVGMIGGGAAAGAIIGAIAGKGKGAAIGAAAGTGAAALTGRENLKYVPGQSVTFILTQPLTVTVSQK
ncbi:MAG: hypothetical protein WCE90_00900 [Candidatus Zixiibacteriota bacterium]